jgi:hypothetical protein
VLIEVKMRVNCLFSFYCPKWIDLWWWGGKQLNNAALLLFIHPIHPLILEAVVVTGNVREAGKQRATIDKRKKKG